MTVISDGILLLTNTSIVVTWYHIYRSQREVVALIDLVLTARGKPYHYLLNNLDNEKLPYKFMAKDLRPAPPVKNLKLTVNTILSVKCKKALVSFYGYPRWVFVPCTHIVEYTIVILGFNCRIFNVWIPKTMIFKELKR